MPVAARGVGTDTVVGLLCPNVPAFATVFHGILRAGATVTTINSLYTPGEIQKQLTDAGATWLVTVSPLLPQAEAAADAVGIPAERLIVLDGAPSSETGGHPNLRELLTDLSRWPDVVAAARRADVDGLLVGYFETPDLEAARARLADLEEKAEGTYVFVRVEALSRATRKQALKDAQAADGDAYAYNQAVLAHTAQLYKLDPRTHPDAPGRTLTFDQWGAFADAIGFMQWEALVDAAAEVAGTGVSPDFSQPASPSPAGDESSKS